MEKPCVLKDAAATQDDVLAIYRRNRTGSKVKDSDSAASHGSESGRLQSNRIAALFRENFFDGLDCVGLLW